MTLRIRDTLTREVRAIEPLEPGRVRIYTCGPTVYRYAHVGNLRSYLLADLIRRVLLYHGLEVFHVKNITDVGHLRDDQFDRGEGDQREGREDELALGSQGERGKTRGHREDTFEPHDPASIPPPAEARTEACERAGTHGEDRDRRHEHLSQPQGREEAVDRIGVRRRLEADLVGRHHEEDHRDGGGRDPDRDEDRAETPVDAVRPEPPDARNKGGADVTKPAA